MRRVIAILLLTASASAQQLTELAKDTFPLRLEETNTVVLVDLNGDGTLDCFRGDAPRTNIDDGRDELLFNLGRGRYRDVTQQRLPTFPEFTRDATTGDLDGDGDPDLVTVGTRTRLYLNDGQGTMSEDGVNRLPTEPLASQSSVVALFDIEGDGDLDLVLVGVHRSFLLFNDGTGHFSLASPIDTHPRSRPTLSPWDIMAADWTGDGNADLLITGIGPPLLFAGDGTGQFPEVPTTQSGLPATDASVVGVATGDVDADGDLDLLLPQYGNPTYQAVGLLLLLNDGTGLFSDVTSTHLPNSLNCGFPVLVDLENDGDLDALVNSDETIHVFRNDGAGRFQEDIAARPTDSKRVLGLTAADVDHDGFADLVVVAGEVPRGAQLKLYLSERGQAFRDVSRPPMPYRSESAYSIRPSDLDGDGDLDLIQALGNIGRALLVNDGTGTFFDETTIRLPGLGLVSFMAAATGDVDRDGDVDVLFNEYGGEFRFYRNAGSGQFQWDQTVQLPKLPWHPEEMRLVDLDGDGNLDIVAALMGTGGGNAQNQLLLGDGTGSFQSRGLPPDQAWCQTVQVADIDGDSDLDLLFTTLVDSTGVAAARLYLNQGGAVFSDFSQLLPGVPQDQTWDADFVDSDQDGDLDLLIATDRGIRHWRQDLGGFVDVSASTLPPLTDRVNTLVSGDLDLDGLPELAFVHTVDNEPRLGLWTATGTGTFVDASSRLLDDELVFTGDIDLVDVDLDGDLDIVAGRILSNGHVQTLVPDIPRRGTTIPITHVSLGRGGHRTAVTLLSLRAAPSPTSIPGLLGKLGLDSSALFVLAISPISPSGIAQVSLNVPGGPSFSGIEFYLQALFVGPSEWRFGNMVRDRIH